MVKRSHVALAGAVTLGLLAGLVGGNAAVSELQQPAGQAPSLQPRMIDQHVASAPESSNADPAVRRTLAYEMADVGCPDCSDYDLGYRSAAQRGLRSTAECMAYSWSYQRGCLAYLRRS